MDLVPTFVGGAVGSYSAKSALFSVSTTDKGSFFDNTGSYTISLAAAATLGAGFSFWVRSVSGSQVIDPDGAELINGAATYTLSNAGDVVLVVCTGTAFVVSHVQLPSGVAITGGTISGVTHVITSSGFTSTLATGSPLVVTATGVCANLNVQYLNSQSGAYYTDSSNQSAGTLPFARLIQSMAAFNYADLVTITGATTATINRAHKVIGTTADFTITLPAISGVTAGDSMAFLMGTTSTLTKMVTLDGASSETIDGATTRVMWANETAFLRYDGTEWRKIYGDTIPMTGRIYYASAQTLADSTTTTLTLSSSSDDTGSIVDAGNNRIIPRRTGKYNLFGYVRFAAGSTISRINVKIEDLSTDYAVHEDEASTTALLPSAGISTLRTVPAGTNLIMRALQISGGNKDTVANADVPTSLSVVEVPSW